MQETVQKERARRRSWGMRFSLVWVLFRKEMLDTLRDRRTLMIMVLLPVVLYPFFGILASQAQLLQSKNLAQTRFVVGVIGAPLPRALAAQIEQRDQIKVLSSKARWQDALRKRELALVLLFAPGRGDVPARKRQIALRSRPVGASSRPTGRVVLPPSSVPSSRRTEASERWPQAKITAFYASTSEQSRAVWERVEPLLWRYRKALIHRRLKQQGLPVRFIRPLQIIERDVVSASGRGRYVLSMMFPALLVILTVMGAFYPAIDLTAGEKERGTLETLLTAPISPLEIVAGKYLAVTCIAMFTGALNLLSLWFTFAHGIRMAGRVSMVQLGLHWGHYAAILGFLLLVAALSAALMIAIASLARSFKEGQNYVTPAYLFCLLPAIMPVLPGAKATMLTACVPILNVSYVIRLTLNGRLSTGYFLLSLASMLVSIGLALVLAARIFAHEQVLFREGEFAFLGKRKGPLRPLRPALAPEELLALLGGLFVLSYYVSMPMQLADPAWGLGFHLWGVVLLLPLLWLRLRRIDWRMALSWRSCRPFALLGAGLIALGAIPLVSGLTQWLSPLLFPDWEAFLERANQTFRMEHFGVGAGMFVFLFVLSPAICEELLFRGVVLSALRERLAPWLAIVLTGLLFGAFHLHLYRLLPTALLGMMLAWFCLRAGSIWPAMLGHAINNGVSIGLSMLSHQSLQKLVSYAPFDAQLMGISALQLDGALALLADALTSPWVLVVGALLCLLGGWLFVRATQDGKEAPSII